MKMKVLIKKLLLLLVTVSAIYGLGRLYYAVTGGFTTGNISSQMAYNPRWETPPLSQAEESAIDHILSQEFVYLGKGCQSYVFASVDGKYVIKFFKYQRFRPQAWINLFTFVPAIERYQQEKAVKKQYMLDNVFKSCRIAYEDLQSETGIIYIHLNKTDQWHKALSIRDKLGFLHQLEIDQTEFLLQHRATMFASTIDDLMSNRQMAQASLLLDRLLVMLLGEYERGFADNDHALMQNTGVLEGYPIHIDVGQFIYNEYVQDSKVYKKEIFDKTFLLGKWLEKNHPELARHLRARLVSILDVDYYYMAPYVYRGGVGKIPNQDR